MKKILYKGRELPCRVTMGAMVRFKRESGRDVSTIQDGDIADLILLLWCCIKSACRHDRITFDISLDDFADGITPDEATVMFSVLNDGEDGGEKKT